jgi:hypothetical protein
MNSLLLAITAFSTFSAQVQNLLYILLGITVIMLLLLYKVALHAVGAYRLEFLNRCFTLIISILAIVGLGLLGNYISTLPLFSMISKIVLIGVGLLLGFVIG